VSDFLYPVSAMAFLMAQAGGDATALIAKFEAKAARDFATIEPWLPRQAAGWAVLDIGAGLGGVDIVIARSRAVSLVHIMDGDGTAEKQSSFRAESRAWADRQIARSLIEANAPKDTLVVAHAPDPAGSIPADLIISLKSWGHHYPAGVYLGLARRSLRVGGRIIMDIRKRRGGGLAAMQAGGFRCVGKAYETPKCERLVFDRSPMK
jgi:SAM-dependent methyltransferase